MSGDITVPHSITALIFYALWVLALVLMVAADRVLTVLKGEAPITSFTPGAPHGSDSYWRLNRAHMNAAENLAIFAAVVLSGWAIGLETVNFNRLAVIVVCARVVQSFIHILSGAAWAIYLRFAAFAVQLVCIVWMAVLILQQAGLLGGP
jgi:uncharacterized MAPEG superfamily protein